MSSNGAPVNAAAQFVPWQLVESLITQKCELPNCASLGYQAKGRGMQLDLQLDLSAAKSPGETLNRRAVSVFFSVGALFLPDTGGRGESIGLGQMSCERGCTCEPMLLDGFRPGGSASTKANSTEVGSAHFVWSRMVTAAQASSYSTWLFAAVCTRLSAVRCTCLL